MHLIEQLLRLSPDGGSGATELAILTAAFAVLVLARTFRGWARASRVFK